MQFAKGLLELKNAYEQLENECRDLRRTNKRLEDENNTMCDRVFDLEQMLGMRREVLSDE